MKLNRLLFIPLGLFLISGCEPRPPAQKNGTLAEARRKFKSVLVERKDSRDAVDDPPPEIFSKIQFESPVGKLAAYLTPDPKDGKKHPAIVWIIGGDCNSIGECWAEKKPQNDQTAAAYRKAGIIMMFPSLRGGNQNPGQKEGFLGEVDDVVAAADHLAKLPYVDEKRIYLGGHSTGGTLVLLVSECSDRFRAIFSFGPVDDVTGYGLQFLPFQFTNLKEVEIRSPGYWLGSIKNPTFVFEGDKQGNLDSLNTMSKSCKNSKVHFYPVQSATHFSTLAPINKLLADKILRDEGADCNLAVTPDELIQAFKN